MTRLSRRGFAALSLLALAPLAAAQPKPAPATPSRPRWEEATDIAIGPVNAPLHLIEYASLGCGHCGHFAATVKPILQKEYIDTGKMRFVFRYIIADPFEVTLAGALVAGCGKPNGKTEIDRATRFLTDQAAWFDAYNAGQGLEKLIAYGAEFGLTEAQVRGCLADTPRIQELAAISDLGFSTYPIRAFPGLILNGEVMDDSAKTPEGMRKLLDAKLAAAAPTRRALPKPAPKPAPKPTASPR